MTTNHDKRKASTAALRREAVCESLRAAIALISHARAMAGLEDHTDGMNKAIQYMADSEALALGAIDFVQEAVLATDRNNEMRLKKLHSNRRRRLEKWAKEHGA